MRSKPRGAKDRGSPRVQALAPGRLREDLGQATRVAGSARERRGRPRDLARLYTAAAPAAVDWQRVAAVGGGCARRVRGGGRVQAAYGRRPPGPLSLDPSPRAAPCPARGCRRPVAAPLL